MNSVIVKMLSLAAYMKMRGASLVDVDEVNRTFTFETDRTEKEWMLDFLKSESSEFDKNVLDMKWFLKKK